MKAIKKGILADELTIRTIGSQTTAVCTQASAGSGLLQLSCCSLSGSEYGLYVGDNPAVAHSVTVTGNQHSATVSTLTGSKFYRLSHP